MPATHRRAAYSRDSQSHVIDISERFSRAFAFCTHEPP